MLDYLGHLNLEVFYEPMLSVCRALEWCTAANLCSPHLYSIYIYTKVIIPIYNYTLSVTLKSCCFVV
jgi:hypothetical protein